MERLTTVFENEEAVKLLNYFVSYKEIINKTENRDKTALKTGLSAKSKK